MIRKVVLINLRGHAGPRSMGAAGKSLAMRTMEMALDRNGRSDYAVYPSADMVFDSSYAMEDLKRLAGTEDSLVFAVSLNTEDYFKLPSVSSIIREEFPGALIVAGGPHFRRGLTHPDSIDDALTSRLADAVVAGHCDPFIQFAAQDRGIEGFSAPGFYRLTGGRVEGSGMGAYPGLDSVPYVTNEITGNAQLVLDDRCANRCDFCSVDRRTFGFSDGAVADVLNEIFGNPKLRGIMFYDSNLFEPSRISRFNRLMAIIEWIEAGGTSFPGKVGLIDPSALIHPKAQEIMQNIVSNLFIHLFMGRETASAASAERMGVNYLSRPKDQERLDNDKAAVLRFFSYLNKCAQGLSFKFSVLVSYIVDPFASLDETLALIDEMQMLEGRSDETLEIITRFSPLTPYPGTVVRRRYKDRIYRPADYSFLSSYANAWLYRSGPTAPLINAMLEHQLNNRLRAAVEEAAGITLAEDSGAYFGEMRRKVIDAYGRPAPNEDEGRVRY